MIKNLSLIAVVVVAMAAPLFAQTPPAKTPPPAPATNASPATAKPDLPAPPPNYEYQALGRRDPFLSLVRRGTEAASTTGAAVKRAEGVPGILTDELVVRGIVNTRGQFVAMVSSPAGKVYTVKAGDKLADGVIRSVTANSVVILQEVNDPLSLEKQREVRKLLRGGEEVK